jgi:putative transposase
VSNPSYKRHRFPPEIIAYAVWLYYRFAPSFRDVEELLASRGVRVSYEAVRLGCGKFGPEFAHKLRCRRRRLGRRWHVDEAFLRLNGTIHYLWRAVDQNGMVVDILVQARWDRAAAERFFRHLLRSSNPVPHTVVTDRLGSYSAALPHVLPNVRHKRGH